MQSSSLSSCTADQLLQSTQANALHDLSGRDIAGLCLCRSSNLTEIFCLQVANAAGQWQSVDIRPNEVAVLIGHTAETASAGVLTAASSRVVSAWPILTCSRPLTMHMIHSASSAAALLSIHVPVLPVKLDTGMD